MKTWEIAVDAPIDKALTYTSPDKELKAGSLVKVPLGRGNRKVFGVSLKESTSDSSDNLKNISQIYEDFAPIRPPYLKWITWMANYYIYPIGQIAKLLFPPLKDKKHGKSRKQNLIPDVEIKDFAKLNNEQLQVVNNICLDGGFCSHLVHGVTGSGKTEIYIELFQKIILQGKKGLFLLPEISLTPQLLRRFAERFGDKIAVLHSQLTERERNNQWLSIVEGEKQILLGARSALFCPIPNLGLIVVDEEHDSSYKQDEKLKYNARDSAVMLASFLDIPIILGSATPSLESWYNVKTNKYRLHTLKSRYKNQAMPAITILDLKQKQKNNLPYWLSLDLYQKIEANLQNNKQIALFLNRRGASPSVVCNACGESKQCPNCAIHLSLHGKIHLNCHYCDYHENFKETCFSCHDGEMIPLGIGTEKVESDLKEIFENAKIARADRDEITSREDMENIVTRMEKEEIDILVGTQMISKGLDFPKLSLVAVVLADIGFNMQDFRANERSYQLLSQVAGRSGRHGEKGNVLIQTYNTQHPVLPFVQSNSYADFADNELQFRKELSYPPFAKIILLRIQANYESKSKKSADKIYSWLKKALAYHQIDSFVNLLGPAEAPMFKLRGKFRYQILIKIKEGKNINSLLSQLLRQNQLLETGTKVLIDVDPLQMA